MTQARHVAAATSKLQLVLFGVSPPIPLVGVGEMRRFVKDLFTEFRLRV